MWNPTPSGYVVLVGDENLKQFPPPSEFLLSVWNRSRASCLLQRCSIVLCCLCLTVFLYLSEN